MAKNKISLKDKKNLSKDDDAIEAKYVEEKPWGLSISVDLYNCDPYIIKDKKKLKMFAKKLVKILKMKAYGKTILANFGESPRIAGYSLIQLIETSGITGHFANHSQSVYLDIFSCKKFRPHEAAAFCKKYFKAEKMNLHITFRF